MFIIQFVHPPVTRLTSSLSSSLSPMNLPSPPPFLPWENPGKGMRQKIFIKKILSPPLLSFSLSRKKKKFRAKTKCCCSSVQPREIEGRAPNHQRCGMQNWEAQSEYGHVAYTGFFWGGHVWTPICNAQSVLINKIFASDISRRFIWRVRCWLGEREERERRRREGGGRGESKVDGVEKGFFFFLSLSISSWLQRTLYACFALFMQLLLSIIPSTP